MGNSGSSRGRIVRSSTVSLEYTTTQGRRKNSSEFVKSKSLGELELKKSTSSSSMKAATVGKRASTSSSTRGSLREQNTKLQHQRSHPLSLTSREIIQSCFENPHSELANRACTRVLEKREDYQCFAFSMGRDRWMKSVSDLQQFLDDVVRQISDVDEISQLSMNYGGNHVPLKRFGFKPDYWVSLAEAITMEGVILDMAKNPPTDTIAAWSQLMTVLFSAIRDGYYASLRSQRRASRIGSQNSGSSTSRDSSEITISSCKENSVKPSSWPSSSPRQKVSFSQSRSRGSSNSLTNIQLDKVTNKYVTTVRHHSLIPEAVLIEPYIS
ncbi:hypothetical protein AB6A40_005022 [Gnathostoma spinigerum]|uniref:Neuroglobin n=1 Tax=Gnathostoma spinigerum TaxID=75299 RepID=A0ABD6EMX4_9BILA